MALEARVKPGYFMNSVQALTGREFVKSEWRPVPPAKEAEARTHDLLEVREVDLQTPESVMNELPDETAPEEKVIRRPRQKKVKDESDG